MLRAVRFGARFGFAIEEQTADAIRESSGQLEGVSRERIGQEIRRMLTDAGRVKAIEKLQELGIDGVILREESRAEQIPRLTALADEAIFSTVLGAWLLDRHAGQGEDLSQIATRWGRSLMLSNEALGGLKGSLEVYRTLKKGWGALAIAGQKRLAVSKWFEAGLELIDAEDSQEGAKIRAQMAKLAADGLAPDPFLDGNDLLQAGISPGPAFGRLLEEVYDAQLEGAIRTKDEALTLTDRLLNRPKNDETRP